MSSPLTDDTIAAIVTPAGDGGIAVIRLSGPQAFAIAAKVFFPNNGALETFSGYTLHLGCIRSPGGTILDQALAGIFRAPHSYTGEEVIEMSLHGGTVLASKVLKLILDAGARPAEPGEFTRRAFLNGKMDLMQAEAVLDLIKSKSDLSIQTAMRQLGGAVSGRLKALKDRLMKLYAHMEAFLDFPDEDLEVYGDREMGKRLKELEEEISALISSFQRGALLREGAVLVIAGKPNVGKSSLFNALLERDRALVSEYAGTTRDALEEWLDIRGLSVRLVDTAGLMRLTAHPLDSMGVARTKTVLQGAQAYLFVTDGSRPLDEEDRLAFQDLPEGRPVIAVMNKSDLGKMAVPDSEGMKKLSWLEISSKTRQGFDALEEKIFSVLAGQCADAGGEHITRLRHRTALDSALQSLRRARGAFEARASLELVTFDLKQAIDALKELIGEIYSEDLLDVIFSEFCIGK